MIFILQDKKTGKGIRPHQAFVILTSKETGDQVSLIVRVRGNGKSKFELVGISFFLLLISIVFSSFLSFLMIIVFFKTKKKIDHSKDTKSAPKEILSSPGNYSFNLVIGTFSHNRPLNYHIGTVEIDLPATPSETDSQFVYGPKPEISHIFRPTEKLPPIFLSYSFALITLTPWMFLVISVSISFIFSPY